MANESKKGGESCLLDGGSDGDVEGSIIIKAAVEPSRIRINKWRILEGMPVTNSQVIMLYQTVNSEDQVIDDKKIYKFKSTFAGSIKKRFFNDGDIVEKGSPILELTACLHTTVIKDMCADCGADLRRDENGKQSEASVPMVHCIPDLKVTQKLAEKLGHDDTRRLLQDRKLVLLVDLDQTLIHTTNDNVPNNIKGIYHFQLYGPQSPWYHTRMRPGTAQFLERMSNLYELHICTFGARNYAHMIAQLLDPNGQFFSQRILSRDECFNATSKTDNLRALFPNGDSMVCIIDDREDVWNMVSNLIQVKPYHFFQHTGDINAPPGLSKHELDGEGVEFKDANATNDDTQSNKQKICTELDTKTSNKQEKNQSEDNNSNSSNEKETEGTDNDTKQSSDSSDLTSDASPNKIDDKTNNADKLNDLSLNSVIKSGISSTAAKVIEEDESSDKIEVSDTKATTTTTVKETPKNKMSDDAQDTSEIEDPDDYLLYLEVILKNIHKRFYAIYDETREIPDLKIIVPKIRSEVLRNQNLVFSGLVPTNMKLEHTRAYFIAKSLGANVTQNIDENTTHLVAVNGSTFKAIAARKNPKIKIVNASWLWSCAERWEHVEEKLFPLDRKMKDKHRQPPAHCHSPEHVVNYSEKSEISPSSSAQLKETGSKNFKYTINPLLLFTNADLVAMNKDFDQFFESDSSSDEDSINKENSNVDKKLLKRKREEIKRDHAHDTSKQSGEYLEDIAETSSYFIANMNDVKSNSNEDDDTNNVDNNDNDGDDDLPSAKFRRGENLPSDLDIPSDSNSDINTDDDGELDMLGAALERRFLGIGN